MTYQLTSGGIAALYNDTAASMGLKPVVQIIDLKKITGGQGQNAPKERYRVILSDGTHYQQAMFTTQLHSMISVDGSGPGITNTCVIKILEYNASSVHDHKIIVILKVEQLSAPLGHTIGNPQNIDGSKAPNSGGSSAPTTPNAPQTNLGGNNNFQNQGNSFQNNNGNNNYNKPPQQHQPPRSAPNVATFSHGEQDLATTNILPIKLLNPYQSSWTIKARVTNKSAVRTFKNAKGEGKFFSIDLIDTQGGEIRATLFNDNADKWNETLQAGQVYFISKGTVKFVTNKSFSTINNEYELTLDARTTIQKCHDDTANIPFLKYNFLSIDKILETPKDQLIDVCGILTNIGALGTILTKAKAEIPRRNLTLIDTSGRSVDMTIWSEKATQWEAETGNVVTAKGVKVSDYNGKTLTSVSSTQIEINPDVPETMTLRNWYQSQGGNVMAHSISTRQAGSGGADGGFVGEYQRRFLSEIKDMRLGSDRAENFTALATITRIKHDEKATLHYLACPTPNCNKKVTEENGMYRCSKCNDVFPSCDPRFILSFAAADFSGDQWFNCFNTEGQIILGQDARTVLGFREARTDQFEMVFSEALFKTYLFKCRAKVEEYNSESRVKCSIVSCAPINYVSEGRHLLNEIRKYGV
eukprot:TRINITY_DN3134_c0_g1_i3.p1 TRINITY_DN3134_c0_g1~~TRINITY_DN3134_c0_g1_i3.p1  ORF type:complete len:699 (+),score=161.52 TRINITY_DN3134_c0_g1_i3:175-2097(+)